MALNQSPAIAIAIDTTGAFDAALKAGKAVKAREAIRVNVIALIKDQTTPIIVTTTGDERSHHFGTLLGSVRWSKTRKEFVVSLNDAMIGHGFKTVLHSMFAEGLVVDKKALKVDTAPLSFETETIEALVEAPAPALA
jgi:hypothetical protein